jgi:nucleoside 2-deoxyribosyltransferase
MKVLLCGSIKHRDKIEAAAKALKDCGHYPVFPDGESVAKDLDEASYKKAMAHEHYDAMREADAVYFVLPDGYMGTSGKLELGYAAALKKPIYFSEKTGDLALDHYPENIIPIEAIKSSPDLAHTG